MSWRDQMGPASFRGVPFFVTNSERGGGRRVVKHEYPFKDEPFAEDMGRKAREFSLDGFVFGDDYLTARDALLDKLEEPGSGELIHPYHGTRRVAVLDFRVRETTETGGMAAFSITFGETPAAPVQPSSTPDAEGGLRSSASAAADSVEAEFVADYSPGALLSSIQDAIGNAIAAVEDTLSPLQFGVQELAAINLKLRSLEGSLGDLLNAPQDLFDSLSELFAGFVSGTREALLRVYAFNPGVRPPATTVNRLREQANFDAVYRLIQRLVVIRAAELALTETFDSYDGAIAARASLTDLLDEQAELAADDTYPALLQLRADVTKAIPGASNDLPRLIQHTPAVTLPSLVLAYTLYGDVDLEQDLVSRNNLRTPSGVTGGKPLEVLSRG